MRISATYWRGVVAATGITLGLLAAGAAPAQAEEPRVFPRDSVQFGRTYSEWAAEWWQWALSLQTTAHPLFDTADCGIGQTGPVFFLGGRFCSAGDTSCNAQVVTRTCSVPAGRALFFPIVNAEDSILEEDSFHNRGVTLAGLRGIVEPLIDGATNLTAHIDGVSIPNLKQKFREQSPAFGFTLPKHDLLTAIGEGPFTPGTFFPMVDDGVYVMVAPLSAGQHVINFHGEFPTFNFTLDVTYHLTVAP